MKNFLRAIMTSVFFFLQVPPVLCAENQAVKCDIQQGPCTATTNEGLLIEFDIQPKPVVAMAELKFSVNLKQRGGVGQNMTSVLLDLSMPGMYMGKNQPALKKTADNRYEGAGIITKCMSGRKTWQAMITIEQAGRTSAAGFIFEVK